MPKKEQVVQLGRLVGRHVDDAAAELDQAGVTTSVVKHELPGQLALLFQLRPPPKIAAGDHVNVIASGNHVVGFELDQAAAIADLRTRVEELERQVGGKG